MIGRIGLLVLALTAASSLVRASVCDELAAFARKLPAKAWAAGDKALAPALVLDEARSTGMKPPQVTGFEASLAQRKDVREAISAGEDEAVFVERLAGTDLYALSTVQGTLHCQTIVLLRAARGRPAKIIKGPGGEDESEGGDCWGTTVGLGRAFGQPVYVGHDFIEPTIQTATLSLTPWTGAGWSKTCKLKLSFQPVYTLIERRCGEAGLCAAAENQARDLAVAYNRFREAGGDGPKFTFGPPAPADFKAQIATFLGSEDSPDTSTPDFPAFGGKTVEDRPISYSGFALFPIVLESRSYVAAVGHEGVGWREGENTLIGFYTLENGALTPKAGYVVERSLAALTEAKAR